VQDLGFRLKIRKENPVGAFPSNREDGEVEPGPGS